VVGVLVEVPVMLSVVQIVRRSRGWYEHVALQQPSSSDRRDVRHISAVVDDLADQQFDARLLALPRDAAATAQHRQAVQRGPGDFGPDG